MNRSYLITAAVLSLAVGYSTTSDALQRGTAGSNARKAYCKAKYDGCIDAAEKRCGIDQTGGGNSHNSVVCFIGAGGSCDNSWGEGSSCLTDARLTPLFGISPPLSNSVGTEGGNTGGSDSTGGGGGRGRERSDVRLKRDIVLLDYLPNGLGLYRYRYLWSDTVYVGVMAQEVAEVTPEAVVHGSDGYLRVNYALLGLRLMIWDQWVAANGRPGASRSQALCHAGSGQRQCLLRGAVA